jgi:hypothetical protein
MLSLAAVGIVMGRYLIWPAVREESGPDRLAQAAYRD